ncbi:MAG: hypothetical protein IPN61_01145, partial [Bacteroidetes bacterium]|nr:hypothetical protein [Bacteroidota bacterium]
MLGDGLIPFPTFNKPYDRKSLMQLKNLEVRTDSDVLTKFSKENGFGNFIEKVFYERDVILYSQRKFLTEMFEERHFQLDDTNVPFDWDNISPARFVYRQHGIPFAIAQWYNSNGNLRAWPYSLNRMDQDSVPALKLDPLNKSHYDDEQEYKAAFGKWMSFMIKHNIKTSEELKDKLVDWSFCNKGWAGCNAINMKSEWRNLYDLIIERNLSICKEWYYELLIEKLLPSE